MSASLKDTVASWLDALPCQYQEMDDDNVDWRFEIRYPARRPDHVMHVAGVPGPADSIVIVSVTRLSDRHRQRYEALPDDEKRVFLFGMRHTLNRPEVDFELRGPGGLDCPEAFQVSVRRFWDGLTLDSFAYSLGAVYKAELSAIWFIQESLDQDPSTPPIFFDFEGAEIPEA